MSDFIFTNQKHSIKQNVWYNQVFLGTVEAEMIEKNDIDWQKYREDKALKMSVAERFSLRYIPRVSTGSQLVVLKRCSDRYQAAKTMLDYHRDCFKNEHFD